MCTPKTLHHDTNGYVAWCKQCNYLNIAFGSVMMALLPDQTKNFISVLSRDLIHYKDKIAEGEKAFIYNTDSHHVKIVLNYKELDEMHDLLTKAMLIYTVDMLLYEETE